VPSWSTPARLPHRPAGGPSVYLPGPRFFALAAGIETPAALGELTRGRPPPQTSGAHCESRLYAA
jgi:hypothetical protein